MRLPEKLVAGVSIKGRAILELAVRRGIEIERKGCAFRFKGAGVDLSACDPSAVTEKDLLPIRPRFWRE